LLQAASSLRGSSCPLCVLSAALAEPVVSTLPPCASMLRAAACGRGTPCAAPPALLAVACMGSLHRRVVCRPYGLACCCMHELAARMLSLFCLSLRAIQHRAAPPCLFWWGATLGCANPRSTSAAARMQRGEPSALHALLYAAEPPCFHRDRQPAKHLVQHAAPPLHACWVQPLPCTRA
jgi:hypothetical protein